MGSIDLLHRRLVFLDVGMKAPSPSRHAGSIMSISSDGTSFSTLVPGQDWPDGIDVDRSVNRMFWTCMGVPGSNQGEVKSADLDGGNVVTIIPQGVVNTPKQIRVEPRSRKLYFADREGMRVLRCDYDGGNLETLVQNGDWEVDGTGDATKWCVGMAVSTRLGKVFWTQKGAPSSGTGRIFCAGIDVPQGETPASRSDVTLLIEGLPEPIDLDLDEATNNLYWTDRATTPLGNSLSRVKLDAAGGSVVHTKAAGDLGYEILFKDLSEAIGLKIDVDAGHVYFTDLGGSLYRSNLQGGERERLYFSEETALTGVSFLQ